ncbi:MAG TPA: rod shape-determining protein MreC [Sphingomonadales bacterium]
MKARRSKGARLAKSFRGAGGRIALIFFTLLALVLLAVSRLEPRFLEQGRVAALDASAPLLQLVAYPVSLFNRGLAWTENLLYVHRENERLRADNAALLQWQTAAQQLMVENARLRALLHIRDVRAEPVATGRVIGQSGGNFVRSVVLNVGEDDGVRRGHMASDVNGIVGRVIGTGRKSSRVLLLTDLNSRIPVKVLPADVNAILAGNNDDQPVLIFLPGGVTINVGDWVVTTGHGGIFPPDMPVGRIAAIPAGADPRVEPAADLTRLDYLRIFAYTPPEAPAGNAAPPKTPEVLTEPGSAEVPEAAEPTPPAQPATPAPAPDAGAAGDAEPEDAEDGYFE